MQKRIAFILCILIASVTMMTCAHAAQSVISVEKGEVSADHSVTFSVMLSESAGMAGWKVTLTWDPQALQLDSESISYGAAYSEGLCLFNAEEPGKLSATWVSTSTAPNGENLFSLSFSAPDMDTAEAASVFISSCDLTNEAGEKLPVEIKNAPPSTAENHKPAKKKNENTQVNAFDTTETAGEAPAEKKSVRQAVKEFFSARQDTPDASAEKKEILQTPVASEPDTVSAEPGRSDHMTGILAVSMATIFAVILLLLIVIKRRKR